MNTFAFGSGAGCPGFEPGAPYNLGRTTTHELGHFFDLRHVWGDGDCSVDDGVADTPLQDAANGGCPAPAQFPACDPGEFELSMNYMDYTDDACMYMFSQGQIDIVDAYVAGVLQPQFKPNTVPICVETPEYTMTDGLINTCNGIFYDSGGAEGNYANNETFTYTICPENTDQIIQLDFISFSTQLGIDILSIYNAENADDPTTLLGDYSGTDAADSPGIVAATTTNTSGCLTIVFTSNNFGNEAGWQANISCQDRPAECQTILAQLDSAAPQPNDDGYIFVCPGEEITLSGSGTFSEPGGGDGATYQWETGDGTLIDGQTVTFSFDEPGVYVANLNIWDTNTTIFPEGCKNTNLINQIIKVSTTPDFSETSAASNRLCFGDSTTITPVVIPTPYINECTPPESEVTFLPDGSGVSYETSIIVDCFDSDQTINDVSELLEICLVLEHSYLGDLDIEIISPSGQTVVLQSQGGGSANLGEPWATAGVDNNSGNTTPGVGYQYCFVPDNTLPTLVGGIVSGGTFVSGDGPGTYNDSFVPEGTYSSVESLEGLVGSFLNGSWTIRITDNIGLDNGYIFSWTLNFDPALQPPNLSFTPEIVSGSWMDDSSITETNGDTITVAPPSEGDFCYTYTALDNFNCEYSYEICINVSPEILYDLPTDLFICDQVSPPYIFDLSENEITMLAGSPNPADYVVTFHNSLIDAENDVSEITNTTAYEGSDNEQIFIRFEYFESNCFKIESFNLNLIDLPQIFEAPDLVSCDDLANDGIEEFDLAQQTALILGGQSSVDYEVSYHEDFASAEAGTGDLTSPYLSTSDAQGIYVRVQSAGGGGCYIVSPDPLFSLIVNNKATATTPAPLFDCDTSTTGAVTSTFDLEQQTATILGALQDPSTFTVTYHSTPTDAESGDSPLVSPLTTTSTTIYVRVEEDGLPDCYETTQFDITVYPNPEVADQSTTACSASTVGLTLADDVDGPSVASYDLTAITPEAGLSADASNAVLGTNLASDAIASDVWTNTTATPLDVVYSFTPVSSDNCIGAAFTVTVTVNPEPEVTDQSTTICSASTVGLTLADDVDGPSVASYDLTAITPEAGLSADASNAVLGTNLASDAIASDVWINTTATPLDVVYSFTPVSSDNCIGAAFTVTVTVNPEPEVTDQSTTICSASTVGLTLADDVDGPSVASYDLTSITPEAGLSADASNAVLGTNLASDAIASDVWTNTTATPLDVVYSFTPVSSDNCIGAAFTVTVTVSSNPEVADQSTTACSASTVGLTLADDVDGPSVASYDLTAITPEAGLSADASNAVLGTNLASDAIASDVWTNTTATPLDVVYSFVPYDAIGCIGEAFTVTVTVNPEPEVTDQSTTICSASTVGLTLADDVDGPSVASYDLTAITPEAGLSADASNAVLGTNLASDAIASDVWINTTATPLDVVYSFTPVSSDNCIGAAFTVTVTVNPEPEVTDQSTTICSASTVGLTLADDVDGPSVASYDLTSITPEAGLSADASNAVLGTNLASDAIASDVWINTTATPLDVVYSFTPVSSDNCIGVAFTVTVTVSSNPEVADQSTTACSASTVGLTLADDVDGPSVASYDLTSITPSAGLSADASNAVLGTNLASDAIASDVWINTTATPLDVVYSFTPVSSDNCIGAAFTVTVTVNPLPVPAPAFIDSKCDDDTDGLQTFDMSGVAAQVIGSQTDMVVSYHLTLTDAENNTAALGDNITTTTPNLQTIHIRLENTLTNCYATSTIDLVVDAFAGGRLAGQLCDLF
jgi:subtilisin-like proprotein convertase family protein